MRTCLVAMMVALFTACAFAGDINLPAPQKSGGPDLLTAIDQRQSAGGTAFPSGALTNDDLSTLLWAASGKNRDGAKWTVPMAMGRPPYCKIFVTNERGVYLYEWSSHTLKHISEAKVHSLIPQQNFAKNVPCNMYVVVDGQALSEFQGPRAAEFGPLLAGMMAQNVYLASQAVGVGARLIYSIDRDQAAKHLQLPAGDTALFAICLGKY
ncbi:MAG: nitroreductase family protein [Planctomycetaceae bacterium]|nr:nitroreductase family protein [Planctomycetaceae bacterium]